MSYYIFMLTNILVGLILLVLLLIANRLYGISKYLDNVVTYTEQSADRRHGEVLAALTASRSHEANDEHGDDTSEPDWEAMNQNGVSMENLAGYKALADVEVKEPVNYG